MWRLVDPLGDSYIVCRPLESFRQMVAWAAAIGQRLVPFSHYVGLGCSLPPGLQLWELLSGIQKEYACVINLETILSVLFVRFRVYTLISQAHKGTVAGFRELTDLTGIGSSHYKCIHDSS